MKFELRPYVNTGYIVVKGSDAESGGSYGLLTGSRDGAESNSEASFMVHVSSTVWARQPGAVKSGKWYHFVGVIDGTTAKTYVNGKLCASAGFSGTISETMKPLWIGAQARQGFNYFFKGWIDDIGFYNRALSDLEVKRLYDAQRVQ